ncbi:MAG: response regulator [Oscillospiraceae bacterium]|jgi:CheY-like chemotaxis protein|nr:response regulator [Oscillospiraceae bacterium]
MRRGVLALVVDDSEINLIVAQELLRALSIEADLAGCGATAVEMCKLRRYDIILMDHLMPEMDGIEATRLIKDICDTPVIAMTANEDPDAQALFLANGFTGFLPKPVELEQMSSVITRLLPKKKPHIGGSPKTGETLHEEDNSGPAARPVATLPMIAAELGLDVQKSISKLGGNETAYLSVLRLFTQTGPEKLRLLENMLASWSWKDFLIAIHGQKSALANIGAAALSEEARIIEAAVKDGKHELVEAVFGGFRTRYSTLCEKLHTLWPKENIEFRDATEEDRDQVFDTLRNIVVHLNNLEQEEALELLTPLLCVRFGEPLASSLTALRSAIGAYDYDGAADLIKRILKGASK